MFKVGDRVTWTSQSQGSTTTKSGEIIAIVPAGSTPHRIMLPDKYRNCRCMYDGMRRDHESYIVAVIPGKTGKASPQLYWPRVSLLSLSSAK